MKEEWEMENGEWEIKMGKLKMEIENGKLLIFKWKSDSFIHVG